MAVFDTNILIDCLKNVPQALVELKRHKQHAISIITSIEFLAGAQNYRQERELRKFLLRFFVVPLSEEVANLAISIRKEKHLKLPDAIILASAEHLDVPLITRNSKDFKGVSGRVHIPYHLH
jgi:predicted nucleic acid-binding protein